MTTRIYCDNCGNTIRDPQVFCFGPRPNYYSQNQNAQAQAYQLYVAGQAQGIIGPLTPYTTSGLGGASTTYTLPTNPPVPAIAVEEVDLCQHCVPIWMARVKNLTKASDVPAKEN